MPRPDGTVDRQQQLDAALDRVARRIIASSILRATGAGLLTWSAAALLLGMRGGVVAGSVAAALGVAVLGLVLVRLRRSWTRKSAAAAIERAHPESRNLVLTAEELTRHPERARAWVRAMVIDGAAAIAVRVEMAKAAPIRRDLAIALGSASVVFAVLAEGPQRAASALRATVQSRPAPVGPGGSQTLHVSATIAAPPYLAVSPRTIENPERLDAIAGSRLSLSLSGIPSARVRFGTTTLRTSSENGQVQAEMVLNDSGFLAIEGSDPDSARKLIAVVVMPDRAPAIRIDRPGKDLLVPDPQPTIDIHTSAKDDFGMRALELRYTKVSGSGEQFEFEEGTLPLDVARHTEREWQGRGALSLAKLNLQPGDSVVYRVVGRDARAGDAGLSSSDTYFVEVAGPGEVTLANFELPPERERYALSQQMIVLKIQRLRAREQSMTLPAIREEAAAIAAEQRAVRANFIFLMGGEVENEEEEAEHSHEIQEGRLENTARREIGTAIQHMGRADVALVSVETSTALTSARAAVEALQRAFGRNRYILRTLPVRSRIDPSRRLSGNLDQANGGVRETAEASPETAGVVSRRLLARLVEIRPGLLSRESRASADLTALAEQALSVDAASSVWQRIASGLMSLREIPPENRSDVETRLNGVVSLLLAEAKRSAVPGPSPDVGDKAMRSAWAAERNHR